MCMVNHALCEVSFIFPASPITLCRLLQVRIQLLAGEVVKIMEKTVFLPQAANVSDRVPRKRVPQPARMSFSGS